MAPHRKNRENAPLVSFYLPSLNENTWEEELLQRCKINSLSELQKQADFWMERLDPPVAFPLTTRIGGRSIHPLLSVGILSRVVGNLFLKRRSPELIYSRMSLRVSITEAKFVERILAIERELNGGVYE